MATLSSLNILKITDGTTTVDLLRSNFGLSDWDMSISSSKGLYRASPLVDNRRLVSMSRDNVTETFSLNVGGKANDVIDDIHKLFGLLEKARDYWITTWQNDPVWIVAGAKCASALSYAIVVNFEVPSLNNPFAQPFFNLWRRSGMKDLSLSIERQHWLGVRPGSSECTAITTQRSFNVAAWEELDTNQGNVASIIKSTSGYIHVADSSGIWRSTNNGTTWVNTGVIANTFILFEMSSGTLLCGNNASGQTYRSTDEGATWNVAGVIPMAGSSICGSFCEDSSGNVYVVGEDINGGAVAVSSNEGVAWNAIGPTGLSGIFVTNIVCTNVDTLIALGGSATPNDRGIWRSTDLGVSWEKQRTVGDLRTTATGSTMMGLEIVDGNIYTVYAESDIGGTGRSSFVVSMSSDDGVTWTDQGTALVLTGAGFTTKAFSYEDETFFLNANVIWKSTDAIEWEVAYENADETASCLVDSVAVYADNGRLVLPVIGKIIGLDENEVNIGKSSSCGIGHYISNKDTISNITHVKILDATGPSYEDIYPISTFPQRLLPAVPAVGDMLYIGSCVDFEDSGPFSGLVFDMIPAEVTTMGIDFEYWDGAAWSPLDTTNIAVFVRDGISAMSWQVPSDWDSTTIDGIDAYWVRLEIDGLGTITTLPQQQNRDIYAISKPSVTIEDTAVLGDIPAMGQIKLGNISNLDGRGNTDPDLFANRVIAGLRSESRGDNFSAFINLSDVLVPTGILVEAETNTTFEDNVEAPTGRMMHYNPVGVEAMATRATVNIDSFITDDYNGIFHVFLRGHRVNGAQTDFSVQLEITTATGSTPFTTEAKQFETTTAWEVLDFGKIQLPISTIFNENDTGDLRQVNIQASAANASYDLYLFDLIFIPVDEWSGDFSDQTNNDASIIGSQNEEYSTLDIDGMDPKNRVRALVRSYADQITSIYQSVQASPTLLQANSEQKLWFVSMQTSATGTSYSCIARPEISFFVEVNKNEQWLLLEGEG